MRQASEEFAQIEAETGGGAGAAEVDAQAVVTAAARYRIMAAAAVSGVEQAAVVVVDAQFGQVDMDALLREGGADGFDFVEGAADGGEFGQFVPRSGEDFAAAVEGGKQGEGFLPHTVEPPFFQTAFNSGGVFVLHQLEQGF